jgi:hypothetical protein
VSLFPDLERTLVEAAVREPRRRRRQLSRIVASSAAVVGLVGVLWALDPFASSGEHGQQLGPEPAGGWPSGCPVGDEPTGADRWRRFDERPVRSLSVLGCGRLADGRAVELVGRKLRSGHVCFDVYLPSAAAGVECAAFPITNDMLESIAVQSFAPPGRPARSLGGPIAAGWATAAIAKVELRYRAGAGQQRKRLTLIRVQDRQALAAADQRAPFGVFIFQPPSRMFQGHVRGYDAAGKPLARAELPRALLPVE